MRSVEIIGYIASVIIFISILSSSILKLRVINVVGSILFAIYGFMIHSIPTGMMNTLIVVVNIYYLVKLFKAKELFTILPVKQNDQYVKHFLEFYEDEIKKHSFEIDMIREQWDVCFFVLRDMATAGLFSGKKIDEDTLLIVLDFAIPEYRDFKIGKYIYDRQEELFGKLGYKNFQVQTTNKDHIKYLLKMNFVKDHSKENVYVKNIYK